jgi:hypothetical protein
MSAKAADHERAAVDRTSPLMWWPKTLPSASKSSPMKPGSTPCAESLATWRPSAARQPSYRAGTEPATRYAPRPRWWGGGSLPHADHRPRGDGDAPGAARERWRRAGRQDHAGLPGLGGCRLSESRGNRSGTPSRAGRRRWRPSAAPIHVHEKRSSHDPGPAPPARNGARRAQAERTQLLSGRAMRRRPASSEVDRRPYSDGAERVEVAVVAKRRPLMDGARGRNVCAREPG